MIHSLSKGSLICQLVTTGVGKNGNLESEGKISSFPMQTECLEPNGHRSRKTFWRPRPLEFISRLRHGENFFAALSFLDDHFRAGISCSP